MARSWRARSGPARKVTRLTAVHSGSSAISPDNLMCQGGSMDPNSIRLQAARTASLKADAHEAEKRAVWEATKLRFVAKQKTAANPRAQTHRPKKPPLD